MVHRRSTYRLSFKKYGENVRRRLYQENNRVREKRKMEELSHQSLEEDDDSVCECDDSDDDLDEVEAAGGSVVVAEAGGGLTEVAEAAGGPVEVAEATGEPVEVGGSSRG
ncbi:hypothetical protein OTU49_014037, partial [Cherax quadricarinatus]